MKTIQEFDIVNESKYEPPYSEEEVKEKYGIDVYNRLSKDPAHAYRMKTGIELIHKEPSKEELERIWKNWNNMSHNQKIKSDKKSIELFGKTNKENYEELINLYVNEAYNSKGYTDYMVNGSSNYVLQQYKRINYPFKISVDLPNYINRNDFEKEVDRIGKEKYNKFWKTHKGYTGNSPFKFYYIISIEKEELMDIVFNNVNGLERLGIILYQYNFSIENRRYSILLITSKNELKSVYFIMHTGKLEKININESKIYFNREYMEERTVVNMKDIYYNKDKFDSGEINLCFITGHSGSGKSTMARGMTSNKVEVYELDDVVYNKMNFTMENFKEYGNLIYSFFNGPGKKYYYTKEDVDNGKTKGVGDKYEELLIKDFIKYSMQYAKSHKDMKYVIEGLWLLDFIEPSELKDYAVYIKGTSLLVSTIRAANRDSKYEQGFGNNRIKAWVKRVSNIKNFYSCEKDLNKYIKYFSTLIEESTTLPPICSFVPHPFPEFEPVQTKLQIMSESSSKNIKYIDIASNKQTAIRYLKQIHGVYTNYINNYNGELAIDKDKDLIVGQIFIGIEEKNKGFISGLWVRKSYRNMGIGSHLINDAIKKYHGIDLTVAKDNDIAIEMYKKRGFSADTNYKDEEYYWMKLKNGIIDEGVFNKTSDEELQESYDKLVLSEEESKEDMFYGLPELKKYPMPDEKHVLSAIRFFNYVSPENEEELAKNIKKKMKEYNISSDHVGDKNRLKKYIKEDAIVISEFEFDNFDDIQLSLVFDLGSVLVENTFHYLDALYSNKNIPNHLANRIYSYIMNTFEGKKDYLEYCSRSEYYRYMTNNAPKDITKYIPTALKVNQATMRKLPYTDELLQYLSKKHKLYYLSNWSKWSIDELIKNKTFDFLKYFEGGIFSGNVGCMKPDHKIYKKLFAQYKLDPKKCIFFDDNKDNVKAAEECGMSAILFNKDYTPQWIMDNL